MNPSNQYSHNGQLTLENMSQAKWYNNWTINIFKSYLQGEILEIGCGIGSFTKILLSFGNVYAIDIDKICVQKTKQKVRKLADVGIGNIETGKLFFKRKRFDTITCINVLEHIQNDSKALQNISNLLKPNGTFILLVPAHPLLFGQIDKAIGHYRRYTKEDIFKKCKKLKLDIVYSRKMNCFGAIGWFVTGKILQEVSVNEKKLKLFDKIAPFILPWEAKLEPPFGTSILIIAKKRKS